MKILTTNNYSLFVLSMFNRDIRRNRWLRESLLKFGWIPTRPLEVRRRNDGKLEIRNGHHRFELARELKIDICYGIVTDEATIPDLVITERPWSVWDSLCGHLRTGKSAYKALHEFQKKTGIPLSSCIGLMSGQMSGTSSNKLQQFKEGTYTVGDMTLADMVGDIIILCQAAGVSFARNNYFVQAVSKICLAADFDPKMMMKKISRFSEFMVKQPSKQHYVKLLQEVYNRSSHTKVPLEFQADEAARQRSAIQSLPPDLKQKAGRRGWLGKVRKAA